MGVRRRDRLAPAHLKSCWYPDGGFGRLLKQKIHNLQDFSS